MSSHLLLYIYIQVEAMHEEQSDDEQAHSQQVDQEEPMS